ncbi:MAG: hypothetical protein WCK67_01255 [bacterium]
MDDQTMEEKLMMIQSSGFADLWSEKILVITDDYEINGYVFLPKTGRKNRVLTDILNGSKRFIAIKDATLVHRKQPHKPIEVQDFIQLNLDAIVMIRPSINTDT